MHLAVLLNAVPKRLLKFLTGFLHLLLLVQLIRRASPTLLRVLLLALYVMVMVTLTRSTGSPLNSA
jgi:hypothetical protein